MRRRLAPGLVLLALVIAVGGGTSLAAWAGARRTATADDRLAAVSQVPTVFVFASDTETFERVTTGPDVLVAAGFGQLALHPMSAPCNDDPANYYQVKFPLSDPPFGTPRPRLVDGRFADPTARDEIVVSEQHARRLDVGVGDRVPFRQLLADDTTGDLAGCSDGVVAILEVVGVVRELLEIGVGDEPTRATTYVTPAFVAERHEVPQIGGVSGMVRTAPGVDPRRFAERLTEDAPVDDDGAPLAGAVVAEDATPIAPPLEALAVGLLVLGVVLAGTTFVTATVAIVRQVDRRRSDLRTLAALGSDRWSIASAILVPTGGAVAIGVLSAVGVSAVLSRFHLLGIARVVEPDPGFDLDPFVLLVGLPAGAAVLVAVGLVAGARAAAGAVRAEPMVPVTGRASLERVGRIGRAPWAVLGLRFALSPARGRRAAPTRLAGLGLGMAAAGLISVLWFGVGVRHASADPAVFGWGDWDGFASFEEGSAANEARLERTVLADPGVRAASGLSLRFKLILDGDVLSGVTVSSGRGRGPTVVAGRLPVGPGEIALGRDAAEQLGVERGGRVRAGGPDGTRVLEVVGLVVLPSIDGGPVSRGWVADRAAVRALGWPPGCNDEEECFQTLAVSLREGADPGAVMRRLGRQGIVVDLPRPPQAFVLVSQADQVPGVAAVAFAIVAAAGLVHALTSTVSRRRRELATLRAIGMDGRRVAGSIVAESLVLGAAGAVIGLVAGIIGGRVAWRAAAQAIGIGSGLPTPVSTIVAVTAGLVLLALLLALPPALLAVRRAPSNGLRADD